MPCTCRRNKTQGNGLRHAYVRDWRSDPRAHFCRPSGAKTPFLLALRCGVRIDTSCFPLSLWAESPARHSRAGRNPTPRDVIPACAEITTCDFRLRLTWHAVPEVLCTHATTGPWGRQQLTLNRAFVGLRFGLSAGSAHQSSAFSGDRHGR